MESVLVSVLMTAYNREKYIGEAIESVLASTYPNFELIVVDDVSKDRTVQIARAYAARDNRIKVYVNEKNQGDYPNRNVAAGYAKGKYIKYLDADDFLYAHGLESMVYYFEQFNNNNIALGVFSLMGDKEKPYPIVLSPAEIYKRHFLTDGILATAPLSTILNREIFMKEGGFSGTNMIGDLELWLKLAAKYDTLLLPGHHSWYRVHGDQESNKYNSFRGQFHMVEIAALKAKDCPLDDKVKEICLRTKNKGFARLALFFLLKQRDIKLYRSNVKNTGYNLFKIVIEFLK